MQQVCHATDNYNSLIQQSDNVQRWRLCMLVEAVTSWNKREGFGFCKQQMIRTDDDREPHVKAYCFHLFGTAGRLKATFAET